MEGGRRIPPDILINNTDPEYVVFQLDCGWASAAGVDPVEYINAHAGRFAAIHVKENSKVIGADEPRPGQETGAAVLPSSLTKTESR